MSDSLPKDGERLTFEMHTFDATPMLDEVARAEGYESYADLQAKAEAQLAALPPEVRKAVEDAERQVMDRMLYGFSVTGPNGERIDPTKLEADS